MRRQSEIVVESPARGRGRAKTIGRACGTTLARGRARGAAPVRGHTREISPKPQIDDREDQVPQMLVSTLLLYDTLLRVLNVLEIFSQGGSAIDTPQESQTRVGADTQEQQQAPIIQDLVGHPPVDPVVGNDLTPVGGRSEDVHKFLTTCQELLEVVRLDKSHGVRYATLQLRGPAREWWRTYSGSFLVGSPLVN
ncbi:hypothetical protein R3W88_001160 [Solanum pinnatisectum]|uniref:Retrotransposon gag domain-containing protein n=1 Tax=Solanum pinnatisectum TaxID=50273 RepID=A0AAV9MI01_9SOLN|nr:hypothetical protein R3W88_001160 [Solanum pinnatisectum]